MSFSACWSLLISWVRNNWIIHISVEEIIGSGDEGTRFRRRSSGIVVFHIPNSKSILQFLYPIFASRDHMLHISLIHFDLIQFLWYFVVFSFLSLIGLFNFLHEIFEDGHGAVQKLIIHQRYLIVEDLDIFFKSALLPVQLPQHFPTIFQLILHRAKITLQYSKLLLKFSVVD